MRPASRRLADLLTRPTTSLLQQVPRALVVSALAAALDVVVLVLLVERGRWSPPSAGVVSYFVGGLLQYLLSRRWVFSDSLPPANYLAHFLAFQLLSLGGLAVTWGSLKLGDALGIHYLANKVV